MLREGGSHGRREVGGHSWLRDVSRSTHLKATPYVNGVVIPLDGGICIS
jgi:hypothetical protein